MTVSLTPPATPPVPAVRPGSAPAPHGSHRSPLTELHQIRRERLLAATALLIGVLAVTILALAVLMVGA